MADYTPMVSACVLCKVTLSWNGDKEIMKGLGMYVRRYSNDSQTQITWAEKVE